VLPNRLAEAALNQGQIYPAVLKKFPTKGFGPHHFAATIRECHQDDPRIKFVIQSLREWLKG
jgi:hypothetical protein